MKVKLDNGTDGNGIYQRNLFLVKNLITSAISIKFYNTGMMEKVNFRLKSKLQV